MQKVSESIPKSKNVDLDIAAQVLSNLKDFILGFAKKMQQCKVTEHFIELAEYQDALLKFLTTAETSPFISGLVIFRIACTVREAHEEEVDTCKRIEHADE